jgi:hypothetical protein
MKYDKKLKHAKKLWDIFPTYSIYPTSEKQTPIIDYNKAFFIYALHKVKKPRYSEIKLDLSCFRIFSFSVLYYKEYVGFAFIPTLSSSYIIRYTPTAVVATHPDATEEAVRNSEKRLIFHNNAIEILKLSCGTEIITDLGHRMNVYIGS